MEQNTINYFFKNLLFIDFPRFLKAVLLNNNDESLYINSYANHHIKNKEGISKINNNITQFITNNNRCKKSYFTKFFNKIIIYYRKILICI